MLIATICVIAVFTLFITITFFATRKSYSFAFDGKTIKVSNAGSVCKVFVDNVLTNAYHMPQLLRGETFKIIVGEKEVLLKCKTNSYGNKFSVKAYCEEIEIYNNNVEIK